VKEVLATLVVVEGTTKGFPKPMTESDSTVSDGADPAAAGDYVDAVIHACPSSDNIDELIHEKADVLLARSTVSGIHLVTFHISPSNKTRPYGTCCAVK